MMIAQLVVCTITALMDVSSNACNVLDLPFKEYIVTNHSLVVGFFLMPTLIYHSYAKSASKYVWVSFGSCT